MMNMKRLQPLARGVMWAALMCAGGSNAWADQAIVAAGAGYHKPVSELIAAYQKHSGETLGQVYGNVAQIGTQARASQEIGMVCDERSNLSKVSGLTFKRFIGLGEGVLVLAYRKGITLHAPQDIATAAVQRVAIPDTKNATYGIAGQQYLEHAGLSQAVQAKLLTVAMVPQVSAYLARGEVDAGFINLTDALASRAQLGGWLTIAQTQYTPIHIGCGVLDEKRMAGFARFLDSAQAHAIERQNGL